MKGVLVIIDGLGDLPVDALGGLTPLESAKTPVMDRLAAGGRYGLVDPIAPGVLPNTHSGAGLLLGIVPEQVSLLHRGPVEAAGLGLTLEEGDVAMRANFATLERAGEGWRVADRRAGRIRSGVDQLAGALEGIVPGEGVTARFLPTEQHRGVLVLSGPGLSADISDTDPGDHASSMDWAPCRPRAADAARTADVLNAFLAQARERLSDHPVNRARARAGRPVANGLITRGAGQASALDSVVTARGLRAAVVAGCNTVRGLGALLGYRVEWEPRFTADLETDLDGKVARAIAVLENRDLAYLHIKGPDICAHDLEPEMKRDFLERIDRALAPLCHERLAVAIAADHTTDSNTGRHTEDPVPALLGVTGADSGRSVKFGERGCRGGTLPRSDSRVFLGAFLDLLGDD